MNLQWILWVLQEANHPDASDCKCETCIYNFIATFLQAKIRTCILFEFMSSFFLFFIQWKLSGQLSVMETNLWQEFTSTQAEAKISQQCYSGSLFNFTFKHWAHTRTSVRNVLIPPAPAAFPPPPTPAQTRSFTHGHTPLITHCRSSSRTDLLLPVVRQGQVVVASISLLIVVHERVQVGKVAVQVDFSGVSSAHQVAVELWTLLK